MPSFEVTTIKPVKSGGMEPGFRSGGPEAPGSVVHSYNVTVRALIEGAYNLPAGSGGRVLGGPGWVDTNRYDIDGKLPADFIAQLPAMSPSRRDSRTQLMQQALLADRFKLKTHFEMREMPIYEWVLAKGGAKLTRAKEIPSVSATPPPQPGPGYPPRPEDVRQGLLLVHKGQACQMTVRGLTLDAWMLGRAMGIGDLPLVNNTGLTGRYDFTLNWTPDQLAGAGGDDGLAPPGGTDAPSLFTAVQEQLGLRLVQTKGPAEVIVIDSIELPSEN
jgi:uncharacterized protein (TIGR03435 family)